MGIKKIAALVLAGMVVVSVGCKPKVEETASIEGCVIGNEAACGYNDENLTSTAEADAEVAAQVQTISRRIPKLALENGEIVQAKPESMTEDMIENQELFAMAGDGEAHYNDIQLGGTAHTKKMANDASNPFVVRKFNKDLWPGGVKLEAEIDPDVMDF
jgi:hypothetical protein